MPNGDDATTKTCLKNFLAAGTGDTCIGIMGDDEVYHGHRAHAQAAAEGTIPTMPVAVATDGDVAAKVDTLLPLLDARYAAHA